MKRLIFALTLFTSILVPVPAHAGSDAVNVSTFPVIANIPLVGNIWSANIPTAVQFEKSSTYPCGDIIIPVTGLLPYSTLADKANGTSIDFSVWSDAGAKIGSGSISSYNWNPVGPITQAKIFVCGQNVVGIHTLLIETLYYTSTTGLLSRYLSTKNQSRINISLQQAPPLEVSDFKISQNGEQIVGTWSAPSTDAPITGYEVGLFDTSPTSPLPPLGLDLKNVVILKLVTSASRQAVVTWSEIAKATDFPGSSIVIKVRAQSDSGAAPWSNGIYLTKQQFIDNKPVTSVPPKPSFTAFVLSNNASVITVQLSANDVAGYLSGLKVTGFISKLRRVNGLDQIGPVVPISTATAHTVNWNDATSGDYEVAVALINSLGQGEWSDYKLVVVPSQNLKSTPAKAVADKAAKKKAVTITCIKGKLTKKVTAVKPKCPAGYKKK